MRSRQLYSFIIMTFFIVSCREDESMIEQTQKTCFDQKDNDEDGLIDCDDSECKTFVKCQQSTQSQTCGNGTLDSGETCDTKIAAGQPGACPTACDDSNACTADALTEPGTCTAKCSGTAKTECAAGDNASDSCCPTGCTFETDSDCSATCGNGTLETTEKCDTKIEAGKPGACPTECEDGNACTVDTLLSNGTCDATCSTSAITICTSNDGCCPTGCDAVSDADCSASCGNGVLEPKETCDTKIASGQTGACPTNCDDKNVCTKDQLLNGATCNATCSNTAITQCNLTKDGCCPAGCNAVTDGDCNASCGNAVVEPSESCDIKIPAGQPGTCPADQAACLDGKICTIDNLINGGTCSASCTHTTITQCGTKDGCCPTSCNANTDGDCSPVCGNGAVEGNETCDTAIPAGMKGHCPATCNDGNSCTLESLSNGGTCQAVCAVTAITTCNAKLSDSCCPSNCTGATDLDCAVCGNGVVEAGERCDIAIPPTGATGIGVCPTSCFDANNCTTDTLLQAGTCDARCTYPAVTACINSDGCCPSTCTPSNDTDCVIIF